MLGNHHLHNTAANGGKGGIDVPLGEDPSVKVVKIEFKDNEPRAV